ncbi:MAG: hypothetical protein KIC66_07985 [Clostridium sp.]|uniref:hypothetical protein n=1 Tax=Clostridium TaxID=1485 RepID=UPI00232B3A01|nr:MULTISPECIES: hypothetical protein [Clostridium]MBS5927011.1 hypothetical protein [Clostridium sp.]MDB2101742.1 hypothetical protein [Clostridium paraputrificum]
MLDLDIYLKQSVTIKLNGESVEVLQPTAKMTKEIGMLEKSITEENYLEIKSKITHIVLNNNNSNKVFSIEDIDNIPYKLQDIIIREITNMVYEADNDPN